MTEEKLNKANELNREIRELESLLNKEYVGIFAHDRDTANVYYNLNAKTMFKVVTNLNKRLEELKKEFEEL